MLKLTHMTAQYSGLGVEEKAIGKLLSGSGMGYIFIQYILLTSLVDRYGFYKSMSIGALFSMPVVSFMPLSLLTNRGADEGTLTASTLALVSVVYAVARACSSIVFSTLTMTTNRTVPADQRAAMNGLAVLGASVGNTLGPAFAGVLFSEGVGRVRPPLGSVLVWWVLAGCGVAFFFRTLRLAEHSLERNEEHASCGKEADPTATTREASNGAEPIEHGNEDRPPSF